MSVDGVESGSQPRSPAPALLETVIRGGQARGAFDFAELFAYRDLLAFMVWRDVKVRYAQTVLGFSWALLRPLVSTLLFSIVFGGLAKLPSDGVPYPLFSYCAMVPWIYFSSSLGAAAGSLVGNNLLSKVYFPRLIVPLGPVLSNLVDLLISALFIAVLMIIYGVSPNRRLLLLPFLVLLAGAFALGLGLWLAALAVQYRDVRQITGFLTTILMYAAPVVWPISLVPEKYRLLVGLYPLVGVIEGFRAAVVGSPVPWDLLALGSLSTAVALFSGIWYFRRRERFFADVF